MGSTEGNLYGLWNARDYLAGMPLLKSAREPISEVRLHEDHNANPNARSPILYGACR